MNLSKKCRLTSTSYNNKSISPSQTAMNPISLHKVIIKEYLHIPGNLVFIVGKKYYATTKELIQQSIRDSSDILFECLLETEPLNSKNVVVQHPLFRMQSIGIPVIVYLCEIQELLEKTDTALYTITETTTDIKHLVSKEKLESHKWLSSPRISQSPKSHCEKGGKISRIHPCKIIGSIAQSPDTKDIFQNAYKSKSKSSHYKSHENYAISKSPKKFSERKYLNYLSKKCRLTSTSYNNKTISPSQTAMNPISHHKVIIKEYLHIPGNLVFIVGKKHYATTKELIQQSIRDSSDILFECLLETEPLNSKNVVVKHPLFRMQSIGIPVIVYLCEIQELLEKTDTALYTITETTTDIKHLVSKEKLDSQKWLSSPRMSQSPKSHCEKGGKISRIHPCKIMGSPSANSHKMKMLQQDFLDYDSSRDSGDGDKKHNKTIKKKPNASKSPQGQHRKSVRLQQNKRTASNQTHNLNLSKVCPLARALSTVISQGETALNIETNQYIEIHLHLETEGNVVFKFENSFYATTKSFIERKIVESIDIDQHQRTSNIVFECTPDMKKIIREKPIFNVQCIGLPIKYIYLCEIQAILKSKHDLFIISQFSHKSTTTKKIANVVSKQKLDFPDNTQGPEICGKGLGEIIFHLQPLTVKF